MFSYYVALGIRSLLNQRLITIWMILLIALGVAGTVSTFSLLRAVSSNSFAAKAHRLFTPQIDNHGPEYVKMYGEIDPVLTLRDVEALRARDSARLQAAIYKISLSLVPADPAIDALEANGYAVTLGYFQMLNVPFRFGSAWSKAADQEGSNEVVIGDELNQKVFRGANSVGQEIRLDGHTYRVAGVLPPWNPLPRFYAASDKDAFDRHAPHAWRRREATREIAECARRRQRRRGRGATARRFAGGRRVPEGTRERLRRRGPGRDGRRGRTNSAQDKAAPHQGLFIIVVSSSAQAPFR